MAEELPDIYVRFEGIDGECTDERHPGKDEGGDYPDDTVFGWFQIKQFTFSFSVKDTGDTPAAATAAHGTPAGTTAGAANPAQAKGAHGTTPQQSAKDDGPFNHPDISLTKALNVTTVTLWQDKVNKGEVIPMAELVACRGGGADGSVKIPFVRLVFEKVYVKSISLSIAPDSLPSETLQFSYERARMESIWTDNDTGERKVDRPRRFGWDFHTNKQWVGEG